MDSSYYVAPYNTTADASGGIEGAMLVFYLVYFVYFVLLVIVIVAMWRLFTKAGKPGWAALIPGYNTVVMLEIAKKPTWWVIIICYVPLVNLVFAIMTAYHFIVAYGKSTGFAVFAIFLPFIAYPIMAFSSKTKYIYGADAAVEKSPFQAPPTVTPQQ